MTDRPVSDRPIADERLAIYCELLDEPRWLADYQAMSLALVGRPELDEWLGRGYFATLVAGALGPHDVEGGGYARAAAPLSRMLAAERLYTDASGVPLERTVAQLLPSSSYAPPYAPIDVKQMLERFTRLAPDAAAAQIRATLLTDPATGAAAAGGIAIAVRQATALWHASALIDLTSSYGWIIKRAPIQTYDSAMVFASIGAPATGIPGPYYGNWSYPPPEVVIAPEQLNRGRK
jgi:hypothetical protein